MRYTGSKNKVARREGMDLGLKTPGSKAHATMLKKLNILPGQHGTRTRRKISEHNRQLREKQKVRFMFGLTEKKLSSYFATASKMPGNTGIHLSELLERRLDNIVYRLGMAPTRASARQLVNHGHMTVDGKPVTIPSFLVKKGAKIGFRKDDSKKIPAIETSLAKEDNIMPEWLERKGDDGVVVSEPKADLIEKQINLRLVIEFYSK